MKIKNEFRILGMQRSGHNAIKYWIYDSFEEPRLNINHCSLKEGRSIAGSGGKKAANEKWGRYKNDINLVIYNFEQVDLETLEENQILNKKAFHIWPNARRFEAERQTIVLVIRDPYNWVASVLKRNKKVWKHGIKFYKKYLKQGLGIENYFGDYHHIILNLNKWFSNLEYRTEIAKQIPITDFSQYQRVSPAGRGSSFDGNTFNGKAGEMKVLHRYKGFLKNKQFISIFKDRELVELSDKYFGFNPL